MTFDEIVTSVLILLGAGIMFLSLLGTRQILHLLKEHRYIRSWRTLFFLMTFFFIGYLASLLLVLAGISRILVVLTGVIFFFGALFVYLVVRTGHLTIDDLGRYTAELERSNQEWQQFAYVVSHDLQEPLRMVISYLQLLDRQYKGQLGTDADEFIEYAVGGASRMQTLIHDLLAYSRVSTRGKPLMPTDSEEILRQTLMNLKVAIEESGAKVSCDGLPTVMADATQLSQVFQNLIGNAIKFRGEESPVVHLEAARQEEGWVFSVRDNGIGIDPQYADRIFLIFQQLHTRGEYPGTGVGLAICKRIVERHGGRIWVESEVGRGSTFYFTVPNRRF